MPLSRGLVAAALIMPAGKPTHRCLLTLRVGAAEATYCGGLDEEWVLLSVESASGDDIEIRLPRSDAMELARAISDRAVPW